MKFVPLKVRERDGESRYVLAIAFKDVNGRVKQDLSKETVLNVLIKNCKLSDEQAAKMLESADTGFTRLENEITSSPQPLGDINGSTEFDFG